MNPTAKTNTTAARSSVAASVKYPGLGWGHWLVFSATLAGCNYFWGSLAEWEGAVYWYGFGLLSGWLRWKEWL